MQYQIKNIILNHGLNKLSMHPDMQIVEFKKILNQAWVWILAESKYLVKKLDKKFIEENFIERHFLVAYDGDIFESNDKQLKHFGSSDEMHLFEIM